MAPESKLLVLHTEERIPLGSATKPYTAAFILKLAEQGKLDLDAPAHMFFPCAQTL